MPNDQHHGGTGRARGNGGTPKCPWCASEKEPLSTLTYLDEAEFVHCEPSLAAAMRNPCMCQDCYGVGGEENFYCDEPRQDPPGCEGGFAENH